MTDNEWRTGYNRCLGVYMAGTVIDRVDERGRPVSDDNFLTLFNAHHERIEFLLPELHGTGAWQLLLDTANATQPFEHKLYEGGAMYPLQGRSMALLVSTTPQPALRHRAGDKDASATQPPAAGRSPTGTDKRASEPASGSG